jgi:hypothetical protein
MVVRRYRPNSMMFQPCGIRGWCYQMVETALYSSEAQELGDCIVVRWLTCVALRGKV